MEGVPEVKERGGISEWILYHLARRWPSPMREKEVEFGARVCSDEYEAAYTRAQFNRKVKGGLGIEVLGRTVLEIGCGHGGISCFMAAAGARRVLAIDVNEGNLAYGRAFQRELEALTGGRLPLEFRVCTASATGLPESQLDLVIADNVFEHFVDVEAVMAECVRILRPGGHMMVPIFSSIWSKYGLHLKNGLKIPWANLLFSERTIVRALQRLALERPELLDVYPGLSGRPTRVREVRKHKDLNDITYQEFRRIASERGFDVVYLRPFYTYSGLWLRFVPVLSKSLLADVLSTGATALLQKRG